MTQPWFPISRRLKITRRGTMIEVFYADLEVE
jgi:hypothetical protein